MSNLDLSSRKNRKVRHASQKTSNWLESTISSSSTKTGTLKSGEKKSLHIPLIIGAVLVAAVTLISKPNSTAELPQADNNNLALSAEAATAPTLEDAEFHIATEVLEYSEKATDPLNLVSAEGVDDIEITTEDTIDLQIVGEQTIHYIASLGTEQSAFDVTFTVRDTHAPSIQLKQSTFTITQGESFDPLEAIEGVTDSVEGELSYTDTSPNELGDNPAGLTYEHGWYTVSGDYDTSIPGTYYLAVEALDNHGNATHKDITLTVEAAPEQEPTVESVAQTNPQEQTYIINTNTGKFHLPGCRAVNQMANHNRWDYTGTREEVISMGYEPCGICHP